MVNLFRRPDDTSDVTPPPHVWAPVFERPTSQTLVEANYLQANPDVAAAADKGLDARRHFERHGLREGRVQMARDFLAGREERGRRRFERFASLLADTSFRHMDFPGAFPVVFGEGHHDHADYKAESANPGFGPFEDEVRAHPDRVYLDVGCGLRPGVEENCLYLEVYPSLTADLVVQPDKPYPLASESFDGIGCFAVLEHVGEPWAVAAELRRMLKPGGLLFLDWPFLQPVHGYPSHFYNATRYGLERMFREGFEVVTLDTLANQGPEYAITWILGELARGLPNGPARRALMRRTVAELIATPPGDPFWRKVTAELPDQTRLALACGNTLIARKV
jgi:SAM-dependent methyltransferase